MNKKILATSVVTAIMLTACGGGGDNKQSPEPIKKITLSGTAVDELILNGKVKVTKPDATLLVEGRTSADKGTYTLDIENYTGPVVINVTCDTDSKLLIGTKQETCPTNLELNSVANAEGKAVIVNISPLSDTVYQIAKKAGITKVSIDKATNQISTVFGINPILNDPTAGAYAEIVEAFHEAADNTTGKDLFDVIDDFVEDISDGVIDDSVALGDALKNVNVTTNVPATGEDSYTVPENPASLDDKAQVKAFIQDLRTQGTTMESYANNEAEAMGTALESVALDTQTVSDYVIGMVNLLNQAREDGNSTLGGSFDVTFDGMYRWGGAKVTKENATTWKYNTGVGENKYEGTIVFPEITDGIEHTFSTLNASFNGTLPYVGEIYSQTPDIQTQNVSLDLSLTRSGDVVNVTLSDVTIENSGNKISIDSLTGSVSYNSVSASPGDVVTDEDIIFNYVKFDAMAVTAVAGDFTLKGSLKVPEYVVNTSLQNIKKNNFGNSGLIPKKISFEGSLKNTKTNGEISGNIDVELVNAITINLVDNDNVGDDIVLKVDVGGKLLMPNRPETLVNIGYETKADNATKHSVTGSYSHDATLLTVAGALDKTGDNGQLTFTNGTGVQAQFILNNDAFVNGNAINSTGSLVTKGGKVIATIESRNDNIIIIKYLDGSFESIF